METEKLPRGIVVDEEMFVLLLTVNPEGCRALIRAMHRYRWHSESPDLPSELADAWDNFKRKLDADLETYRMKRQQNREAANSRWKKEPEDGNAGAMRTQCGRNADASHNHNHNHNQSHNNKINPSSSLRSDDATAADAAGRMDDDEEIFFDEGEGHLKGITPEQIATWQAQYLGVNVKQVIRKTETYMADHPGEVRHCKRYLESCLAKARDGVREHAADTAAKSGAAAEPAEDDDDADWRRRKEEEAKARALMYSPQLQPKETALKRNNPEARINS